MEPLVGPPSSSSRYSKDRNRLQDCLRRAGCEHRYHSLAEKSITVGLATGPLLFHRQYTAFPLPNMCGRFDHQSRLWPRVYRRKDPLIPVNDRFKVYSGMPYRKKYTCCLRHFALLPWLRNSSLIATLKGSFSAELGVSRVSTDLPFQLHLESSIPSVDHPSSLDKYSTAQSPC